VLTNDNIFLIFIGILVSTIVYQSQVLTKIYKHIFNIENRIRRLEGRIK
jgi:hypothetical protein